MWCSQAPWRRSSTWTRCSTRTRARWAPAGTPGVLRPPSNPPGTLRGVFFPAITAPSPEARPSRCWPPRRDPPAPGRGNEPQTLRSSRSRSLGDRRDPGWGAGSRKTRERQRESSCGTSAVPPGGAQAQGTESRRPLHPKPTPLLETTSRPPGRVCAYRTGSPAAKEKE